MRRCIAYVLTTASVVAGMVVLATPQSSAAVATPSGVVKPILPTRVVDTRSGLGGDTLMPGDTFILQVTGQGQVPDSGVAAVLATVTVTDPESPGYLTAWAGDSPMPVASNLNFSPGQTVANTALIPVAADGTIAFYNGSAGTTDLIVDLTQYITAGDTAAPGGVVSLPPARILDTRASATSVVGADAILNVPVLGHGGIPLSGVSAVVLNITVTAPSDFGYITAWAHGTPRPNTSNVNFVPSQTVPNFAVVPVGSDGSVDLYNGSLGDSDLLADVAGYVVSGSAASPGALTSLAPARLLDTRSGSGGTVVPSGGTLSVSVLGRGGLPASDVAAAVLNVTVTQPQTSGYLTAWSDTGSKPMSSNLNFDAGQTVANAVVVSVGGDGKIDLFNGSGGTVQIVADAFGYTTAVASLTWSAPKMIDPPGGSPMAISCPTETFCAAVDQSRSMVTFNGATWSTPVYINAAASLESVSCVSASFCVAVDDWGYAYTYDGSTWAKGTSISQHVLLSVSCASQSFCVAVDTGGNAIRFSSGVWAAPVTLGGFLTAVSCPSTSFCMAVDDSSSQTPWTFNGATWSATSTLALTGGVNGLSCLSSVHCVASSGVPGSVTTYDGTTWSSPVTLDASGELDSISCPSTTLCVAADDTTGSVYVMAGDVWSESSLFSGQSRLSISCVSDAYCVAISWSGGSAWTFNGTTWSAPVAADPFVGQPLAVSCASSSMCVVIDGAGRALRYDGTSWSTPVLVDPDDMNLLSCPTTTFCLAVDYYGRASMFDGTSWSAPASLGDDAQPAAVSCSSADFCVVADVNGRVFTFDGHSWGPPEYIAQGYGSPTSMSCFSSTSCLAMDQYGDQFVYDGTAWQPWPGDIPPDDGRVLRGASCVSQYFCVGLASTNLSVHTFDGASWSPPAYSVSADAVSCVSDTFCMDVTDPGPDDVAYTFDGSDWSPAQALGPATGMRAVSCPNTGFCVAIDGTGYVYVTN